MADILVTHSYFLRFDRKQEQIGQPYAPLGTLYAASVLRHAGMSVAFHDVQFERGPDSLIPALDSHHPRLLVIYDDGFNYLTKMCLTNMREAAFEMCGMAARRGIVVVVCSSDSTDQFALYLERGADAVILGEGELTLLELATSVLKDGAGFSGIKGVAFRDNGVVKINPKRPLITDPDELPFPAWDLLDVERYRQVWKRKNGYFTMNMVTTRGCPFQCIWCAKPIYGNHYHSRSPGNVADEMKYLKENFAPDALWFADDIFGLRPGWTEGFAREVNRREAFIPYTIQTRADLLLEEGSVASLASSGCRKAWLCIESGSQKILDAMHKGITLEQVRKASTLLRNAGISQAFFLQLGFPGEEADDIRATISLIEELLPDDIGISVTYPLPGTRFYEAVKKELREKQHWSESNDLAMMFESPFSPRYYRLLHRYIHKRYRFRQAIALLTGKVKAASLIRAIRSILLSPYYLSSAILYHFILKMEERR
jgi:radical SAM superfamily enzyme YgiQ (UPF0313 family)